MSIKGEAFLLRTEEARAYISDSRNVFLFLLLRYKRFGKNLGENMLTIAYSVQILGTRPCWGLLNPQIIIEVILWRASAIPNEAYEFIFGSHTFFGDMYWYLDNYHLFIFFKNSHCALSIKTELPLLERFWRRLHCNYNGEIMSNSQCLSQIIWENTKWEL